MPRGEIMVRTSPLDVIATTAVGIMSVITARNSIRTSSLRLGEDHFHPASPLPMSDAGVGQGARQSNEVIPGRLYSADDLHQVLPPTLARIVISRCRMIDGVILGQAVIEVLTRSFLDQADAASTSVSADLQRTDLMTLKEAGEYMRVSERTISRMVAAGTITAQNLAQPGSKKTLLRFTRGQLDRDMKKAETSTPTTPPSPKFRFKFNSR